MPITQATTNVINLNRDTIVNGVTAGRGTGNIASNTAFGSNALLLNTSGNNNTAIGRNALDSITTGFFNTAIGADSAIDGNYNQVTAVGWDALHRATSGDGNTAVGASALSFITTGGSNTAVGAGALGGVISATNHTAIGETAGTGADGKTNCTFLGRSTAVTASNQVQLGDAATTTYAYGAVQNRSDVRDKSDIRDIELGLDFVNALRPVDFKWDMREDYRTEKPKNLPENATQEEKDAYAIALSEWKEASKLDNIVHDGSKKRNRFHHGLIAQEVKSVLDAKGIDFGGFQNHKISGGDDVLSIGYTELIAPMLKAIQELSAKIAVLEAK